MIKIECDNFIPKMRIGGHEIFSNTMVKRKRFVRTQKWIKTYTVFSVYPPIPKQDSRKT